MSSTTSHIGVCTGIEDENMDIIPHCTLILAIVFWLFAGRASAENAEALFVFGDSYADTGNRNPYNQSDNVTWRRPYGLTWPGYPAGRFSSGKIQTDYWADILGLPSPVAYELLRSHNCTSIPDKIRRGVNFAVGGSGLFHDFGFTTVPKQVEQFKNLIAETRGFDSQELRRSIVLISVAGNDYVAFIKSRNGSIEGLVNLVKPVVSGIVEVAKDLYQSGLRNFVVSGIAAFGCGPQIGKTSCDSTYDGIVELHMNLLSKSVQQFRSNFKGVSIIISDLVCATHYVFSNPAKYDFVDLFTPCCATKGEIEGCAETDEIGRALYDVCNNVDNKFFWDFAHPTERGWYAFMSLYCYGADTEGGKEKLSFIEGAPNVIEWVQSLGFLAHNISLQSSIAEM